MRSEKATFTNMCMIYDDEGNVVVQRRASKVWPGITFPGGHVEKEESFVDSVIREVKEETGLDILNPQICGVKQFTTEKDGRYIVLCFKTNEYSGELISSAEGEVKWMPVNKLHEEQLTDGFNQMLRLFTESASEHYSVIEDGIWQSMVK